jgi:hypothetical protein
MSRSSSIGLHLPKKMRSRRKLSASYFVQKMEAENRKLRGFLTFLGMQPSVEAYLHMGDNSDIAQKIAISALQGSEGAAKLPYQESRRTSPCSYRCGPQDSASFTEPLEQPVPNGSCQQIQRCAKNNAPYLGRQMIQYVVLPVSRLHDPPQTAVHLRGPAEQPVVGSACQQSPGVAKNKPPYLKQPRNSVPGATCQQSCGPSQECIQEGHDSQPLSTDQSFCGCPPIDRDLGPWPLKTKSRIALYVQLRSNCSISIILAASISLRFGESCVRASLGNGDLAKDAETRTISY